MLSLKRTMVTLLVTSLVLGASLASAKITPQEAEKLKNELTPLGAEKAGNADGSIPAWTGEGVTIPKDYAGPGSHMPNPFPGDKPLFTITAANLDQYADKLTEGQKGLFKAYPDTFKMPIYQTRRTAIYSDEYVKGTYDNALTAELDEGGNGILNAWGGIPFPIPKNGLEAMWNHQMRYRGVYFVRSEAQFVPDREGRYVADKVTMKRYMPYYDPNTKDSDMQSYTHVHITGPPRNAGDKYIFHDAINPSKKKRTAWRYFNGQRRVRRAPVLDYDTPVPTGAGLRTMDDYDLYTGSPDRFDWKLLGKKEIYVPYNNYELASPNLKYSDIIKKGHINPDHTRYELHRVWIVEATLKDGARHIYSRRVKYIDEDSWAMLISDRYDERGNLWRTAFSYTALYWDAPAIFRIAEVHHDLVSRRYNAVGLMNEEKRSIQFDLPVPPLSAFSASTMRRSGR